jgi:large subunit ribosomal protein L29
MKKNQFEEKTIKDLECDLEEKKKALTKLRFQLVANELKDNTQISKTRKDIARIKTYLTMKRS